MTQWEISEDLSGYDREAMRYTADVLNGNEVCISGPSRAECVRARDEILRLVQLAGGDLHGARMRLAMRYPAKGSGNLLGAP